MPEAVVLEDREAVVEIPIGRIRPNPYQPRRRFDPFKLEELAQSIRESDVIEPIVVRRRDGEDGAYELVVGERRLRASQIAGRAAIRSIIRDYSAEEARELVLVENTQREDLTPIEEAHAYSGLVELYDGSYGQVAERIGKTEQTVRGRVALLALPDLIQEMLEDDEINVGQAGVILEYEDEDRQRAADLAKRMRYSPERLRAAMQKGRKKLKNTDKQAGVVRSSTLLRLLPQTYDALEGFDYVKFRDPKKRMVMKHQLENLHQKIGEVLKRFGLG